VRKRRGARPAKQTADEQMHVCEHERPYKCTLQLNLNVYYSVLCYILFQIEVRHHRDQSTTANETCFLTSDDDDGWPPLSSCFFPAGR